MPLLTALLLVRIVKNNQAWQLPLLYQEHEWGYNDSDYLAIHTQASREGGRHTDPKVFIARIRSKATVDSNELNLFITQQSSLQEEVNDKQTTIEVIFAFKDVLYRATPEVIEPMSEYHKLKLLGLS